MKTKSILLLFLIYCLLTTVACADSTFTGIYQVHQSDSMSNTIPFSKTFNGNITSIKLNNSINGVDFLRVNDIPGTIRTHDINNISLMDISKLNTSSVFYPRDMSSRGQYSINGSANSFTEEFVLSNSATTNNSFVIDPCNSVAGWSSLNGNGVVLSNANGYLTANGTPASGQIRINKYVAYGSINNRSFVVVSMKCNVSANATFVLRNDANYIQFLNNVNSTLVPDTWTTFVLPFKSPVGSGFSPTAVSGTFNYGVLTGFTFGVTNLGASPASISIRSFVADNETLASTEIQTPDNLSMTSAKIESWNVTSGSYEEIDRCSLDGAFSDIANNITQLKTMAGEKLSYAYNNTIALTIYPKGSRGDTVIGSDSSPLTYLNTNGANKRIGLKFRLPLSNGISDINKVKLRLTVYGSSNNTTHYLDATHSIPLIYNTNSIIYNTPVASSIGFNVPGYSVSTWNGQNDNPISVQCGATTISNITVNAPSSVLINGINVDNVSINRTTDVFINHTSYMSTYVVPATSDVKILPKTTVSGSHASSTINVRASPNEYALSSFVVNADENISNLCIQASNLVGNGYTIPSSSVDIKTVKCWYRGGFSSDSVMNVGKYLTPDLLLHNDSIVYTNNDSWAQWSVSNPFAANYLDINGATVNISDTTNRPNPVIVSIASRPIQDTDVLQPFNLPSYYNKQFFVTMNLSGVPVGNYTGTIQVVDSTQTVSSIPISVQVLNITLLNPSIEYSSYYHGTIDASGSISSENKTEEQFIAEQKDMYQHGITNPIVLKFGASDSILLQELDIRRQIGMNNTNIYTSSGISDESRIPYYMGLTSQYGVQYFYMYGPDETDLNNPTSRAHIASVHSYGGKYFNTELTYNNAYNIADVLDFLVAAGLWNGIADRYHSFGHKVYLYNTPQAVPTYPNVFRVNYGLSLWQYDYDGAIDYAYQSSMGDIWNDWDNTARDHMFTLPTANGVIDTLRWEGYRSGVTDMRYLATLQYAIADGNASDPTVAEASNYLTELKSTNLNLLDMDVVRSRMINYILAIQTSSHNLSVIQGTGSGYYAPGSIITINATPQTGTTFSKWVGSTEYIANANNAETEVTMPAHPITLIAQYKTSLDSWNSLNYSNRKTITINHNKVSETDQYNFPVLINITDNDLKSISNGGKIQNAYGYDMVFTSANDNVLNYEVESYNNSSGQLIAWVNVPVLSASVDTMLNLYFGNPNISSSMENKSGVWDSYYIGVWHMKDFNDSTSYANNGVNAIHLPTSTSGQIGDAKYYDSTQYVTIGSLSILNPNSTQTIEALFKVSNTTEYNGLVSKYAASAGNRGYALELSLHAVGTNLGGLRYLVSPDGTTAQYIGITGNNISINEWHQAVGVYDGEYLNLYLDGNKVQTTLASGDIFHSGTNLVLGQDIIGGHLLGSEDEVRLSNTGRSASRIKTQYNNQFLSSTFYATGASEFEPITNFTVSKGSFSSPLTRTFTDTSEGTPNTWLWDFGDWSYSTDQNPTHNYLFAGNYTVTLTATNGAGENLISKSVTIYDTGDKTITLTSANGLTNSNTTSSVIMLVNGKADTSMSSLMNSVTSSIDTGYTLLSLVIIALVAAAILRYLGYV